MVWYAHLFQNFPQFIVIHTLKGFGMVNKAWEQNHTTAGGEQPYFPTENPKIVPIFGGASRRPHPTGLCDKLQFDIPFASL